MMDLLHSLFGAVCGQNPAHTWSPGGVLLPCCQRCLGLYAGAAVAMGLHWWFKPKFTGRFLEVHGLFLLLMVPFGFHWLPEVPVLRTLTGILFGFGIVTFLRLPIATRTDEGGTTPGRLTSAWRHGACACGLVGGMLVLPLLAAHGGEWAGFVLPAVAVCGLAALAGLVMANLCLAILATLRHGVRLRRARQGV